MNRRRLKPLIWPVALLVVGGLTAGLAELSAMSVNTITLYGMIKMVSDLVLVIAAMWLVAAVFRAVFGHRHRDRFRRSSDRL